MMRMWPVLAAVWLTVACSSGSSTGTAASGSTGSAGSASGSTASGPAASGRAASADPAQTIGKAITVAVAGRRVSPPPGRVAVRVGEHVRLTVISDVDNEVHVHGVDVEKELTADIPTTFVVTNDQPGVYEVELHHPALLLFQFVVR